MQLIYPPSVCPDCGTLVENVPPNTRVRDFCPKCSKFAPKSKIESGLPPIPQDKDKVLDCKIYAIKCRCPGCEQKLELDAALLDTPVRCPQCSQKLKALR